MSIRNCESYMERMLNRWVASHAILNDIIGAMQKDHDDQDQIDALVCARALLEEKLYEYGIFLDENDE